MGLFGLGKKKEEAKGFTCSIDGSVDEGSEASLDLSKLNLGEGLKSIMILGSGCKACHMLYENTKQAVAELNLDIQVDYIDDLEKVMEYGILTIPGLVINGEVVSVGKALKPEIIKNLLQKV